MKNLWKLLWALMLIQSMVTGCAPISSSGSSAPMVTLDSHAEMTAAPRANLGTRWGETRHASVREVEFRRATPEMPLAQSTVYYSETAAGRGNYAQSFPLRGGWGEIALENEHHQSLPGFIDNGQNYVQGQAGQRYIIRVRNLSNTRMEAVLSVDGLDVLDGQTAAFRKPGYLINPGDTLRVEGFRQSLDNIATFRFSSMSESYAAQKYADTRNVGVIGLALFHEQGSTPRVLSQEIKHPMQAEPFPGNRQFATPP